MQGSISAQILSVFRTTHQRVISLINRAGEEQYTWQPVIDGLRHPHSMAFNLWHLARWADHLQARLYAWTQLLSEPPQQQAEIWEREELAKRWGFDEAVLGQDQTGMLMADDAAEKLPLPPKTELVDYAQRAFTAEESALETLLKKGQGEPFLMARADMADHAEPESISNALLVHLMHENRHLGELELLLGLQGEKGTATR